MVTDNEVLEQLTIPTTANELSTRLKITDYTAKVYLKRFSRDNKLVVVGYITYEYLKTEKQLIYIRKDIYNNIIKEVEAEFNKYEKTTVGEYYEILMRKLNTIKWKN